MTVVNLKLCTMMDSYDPPYSYVEESANLAYSIGNTTTVDALADLYKKGKREPLNKGTDLINKIERVIGNYRYSYVARSGEEINLSLFDKDSVVIDQRTQAKELGLLMTSTQNFQGVFQEFLALDEMQVKSDDQIGLLQFRNKAASIADNLNKCIDTMQSVLLRIRPFTTIDADNAKILAPVLDSILLKENSLNLHIAQYMD